MSEAEFGDRTVLVTGGPRGIGRACYQWLAKAGARLAINYHARKDDARETATLVESTGGQAMIVQADVADQQSVEAMVAHVNDQFGPIEMLVNNAGIFELVGHDATTLDLWITGSLQHKVKNGSFGKSLDSSTR